LYTDITEINTVELPKLPEASDGTELWEFMKFLNAETEEEMETLAERTPNIRKTVVTVKKLSADEEMRMYAEAKEKARRDEASRMKHAIEEAVEKAVNITIIANTALKNGKSVEEAARISGLDVEKVRKLAD
jgi:predicted transposase/invertase (TIGR01784 family)